MRKDEVDCETGPPANVAELTAARRQQLVAELDHVVAQADVTAAAHHAAVRRIDTAMLAAAENAAATLTEAADKALETFRHDADFQSALRETARKIFIERKTVRDTDAAAAARLWETFQADLAGLFTAQAHNMLVAAVDAAGQAAREQLATLTAAWINAGDIAPARGYREALWTLANQHHGIVTTKMADAAGIPPVELRKLANRGGITNVAHGVYRVDGIEHDDKTPFAEAVFQVGEDAHLAGESVLALHQLALVNPTQIAVATPRRVRRELPGHIRLVRHRYDPDDVTVYDGVPSTTVRRAILDTVGTIPAHRLTEAVERATDEGFVRHRDRARLLGAIAAA
jgi:hypothetical protein